MKEARQLEAAYSSCGDWLRSVCLIALSSISLARSKELAAMVWSDFTA